MIEPDQPPKMPLTPVAARQLFLAAEQLDPQREAELEVRFFSTLLLPDGSFKTTYRRRLHDVDAAVCDKLQGRADVRLLDFGVSSGVTTLELMEALEERGVRCETTAADICINARLRRLLGFFDLLVDSEDRVLQIATPWGARCRLYQPERSLARQGLDRFYDALGSLSLKGEPLTLLSPRLLAKSGVEAVEQSVLVERANWRGRFDVVRAANLLNRCYFTEEQIRAAVRLLGSYLSDGGLLVICRTHEEDGLNHATIFELRDGGLRAVGRVGAGSDIEALAVALGSPAQAKT